MMNVLLVVALLGDGFLLSLTGIERKYAYPFDRTRIAPEALALSRIEERRFPVKNATLVVWVAPPQDGRATVLYFHGNGGNLANRALIFDELTKRGYGLIAPAYRGSSGSSGRANEARLTRDAQAVWENLDTFVQGLTAEETVFFGESLGSGVTLKLLATPDVAQPAGAALMGVFTSYPDVALVLAPERAKLISKMRNIWDNTNHINALRAPLLMIHGTADHIVPFRMGAQIFDAAPVTDKTFIAAEGAAHFALNEETKPALWAFLDRVVPPAD